MEVKEVSNAYAVEPFVAPLNVEPWGYKQTDAGVIPDDWETKPLQALADKIMVGIASAATHAYRSRGVVMFRNQNIRPNHLDDTDVLYIDAAYEETYRNKRLKAGDLLTARTGYPGTTSIVPKQYEGAQSFTTLITRPRQNAVDSEYLCRFINSEVGKKYFEQNQIGGGQKNVNAGSLKQLIVPLPPTRAEQEAIAEALSDADALIESLEQLIAKKRQIKQGTMQALLTGQRRLPGFTGEWSTQLFGEIAMIRRDRIDPRKSLESEFCVELEHIGSGTGSLLGSSNAASQSSLKSVFQEGDVLFGKLRAYLRKYWFADRAGVCSTEIWCFTSKEILRSKTLLFYLVQMDGFIDVASLAYGTHMPRSDWNAVKEFGLSLECCG